MFNWSVRRSAAQLQLLLERRPDRVYFSDPAKSFFIADSLEEKEASKREFKRVGLNIRYVNGGKYLGTREELEEWVRPKVEALSHWVHTLAKIAKQYPQLAYSGLGMSLQL